MMMYMCGIFSLFISFSNPLLLSILIIMFTLLISMEMHKYLPSWLVMILLLIYLGGMMIILLYMSSLMFNEKWNMTYILFFSLMATFFTLYYLYPQELYLLKPVTDPSLMIFSVKNMFLLILTVYLFMLLSIVSKIILKNKGALRTLN